MPNPERRTRPSLSVAEAQRAVYLDFEGFMNQPPCLAGVLMDGRLEQVVLDPVLEAAGAAKNLRTMTFEALAEELKAKCESEERKLVAFTTHEKAQLELYAPEQTWVAERYVNAHRLAKYWVNSCRRDEWRQEQREWDLSHFLRFISYEVPRHHRGKHATSRLTAVRDQLQRRGSYAALTPVAKAKWTKLLDYNAHDCFGMRDLVSRAAQELETRCRSSRIE